MNRRTTTGVLAAAYLLTLATSALFLARDSVPPRWDAAGHLLAALDYRDLLLERHLRLFLWRHYAYYPPLVYQLTAALQAVSGPSALVPGWCRKPSRWWWPSPSPTAGGPRAWVR